MRKRHRHSNPYMGIIVLISLTKVSSDRCSFDEMQVFPSPPEFPDFMASFEGTILRLGLTNLLPSDRLTLSNACPESMNWSEFNSRLCDKDPFDLDAFCNPPSTAEQQTVTSLATPQQTASRSMPIETRTSDDLGNETTLSTDIRIEVSTGLNDSLATNYDTDSTSIARTAQPPTGQTDSNERGGFKDRSSAGAESEYEATRGIDSADTVPPSDALTVNDSTGEAQALYQGGGASIAIGVGCGLTLLCILIIVIIIALSHQTRGCGCRRLMNPLFKVFQRQTSDVRPLTWSLSNQPSTPLEEIRPNGDNINDCQQRND